MLETAYGKVILSGAPWRPTFLLRDDFTTDASAPLTSPRTAEPGPGTLTLVQTDGQLSTSGGTLAFPAQSTPAWGDLGLIGAAQTRLAGRTLVAKISTTLSNMGFGWNDQTPTIDDARNWAGAVLAVATVGFVGSGVSPTAVGTQAIVSATQYSYALVLRAAGMFMFIKGAAYAQWTLMWVDVGGVGATVYPALTNYDSVGTLDNFRVLDLPAPFSTDYGLATQRLAGARAAADTFTHTANFIGEYVVTTLPASGNIAWRFRIQDEAPGAEDFWTVVVNSSGDLGLNEVTNGSSTGRATAAGVVSNGHRVVIVADGTTIRGYSNNVLRWTYSSASNYATMTNGNLASLGTGGAVSDIISWPRTLSNPAAGYLDLAVA